MVDPTPWKLQSWKKDPFPLYRRLGGSQDRSGGVGSILPLPGILCLDRSAHNGTLHLLSYPGQLHSLLFCKFWIEEFIKLVAKIAFISILLSALIKTDNKLFFDIASFYKACTRTALQHYNTTTSVCSRCHAITD
jgi:hypothetical protein